MEEKTSPRIGISYGRGGTATATSGGYDTVSRGEKTGRGRERIPWLKVMITIVIIIMLVFLFLALSG
jgi:hypothetical protein